MFTTNKLLSRLIFFAAFLSIMYQESPAQASRPASTSPPDIAYSISLTKPSTHLLEVEMRVRWNQMPRALELKMPVWTPGSYLIREYARHVQDFQAKTTNGAPVTWRKI